ncbi:hypothetical protein ES707_09971 [subsurface metagenome]
MPGPIVTARIEQDAFGLEAVAAGPTAFLLVVFERLGHAGVNHVTYIGLINTHAEGDGSHDDVGLLLDEGFLVFLPVFIFHAGMVR